MYTHIGEEAENGQTFPFNCIVEKPKESMEKIVSSGTFGIGYDSSSGNNNNNLMLSWEA